MDLYSILKLLHVISALAWVGGGMTLLAQSIFAVRDHGEMATLRSLEAMGTLAKRWFIPASLLTLVFGVAMTVHANLWGELWIILGLAGFATTFLTGMLVFEPKGKAIRDAMARGDEAEALRQGRALLRISKFDYVVMVLVVADMVLKPGYGDWPILLVGASIIVAAAGWFLFGLGEKRRVAAA